jgi:hypothetical protein
VEAVKKNESMKLEMPSITALLISGASLLDALLF